MIVILSPAKSMDFNVQFPSIPITQPQFAHKADELVKKLARKKEPSLMKMMDISQEIARLNVARFQHWGNDHYQAPKPAVFTFTGEVYRGLKVLEFRDDDLHYAQDHLRILSGLYGILRPMDMIRPYRLEMGSKFEVTPKVNNLYKYWKDALTENLSNELQGKKALVNLASNEYAKAINMKGLPSEVHTPVFKELKNGKYVSLMTYAKNARGRMAAWILRNRVEDPNDLRAFDLDGYHWDSKLSAPHEPVFTR